MSQKFQSAVNQRDRVAFVKIGGVIDEDNELGALSGEIDGDTVIIDLGAIERINSCGVRDWVNWLGGVESNSQNILLVECSPAIVAQINLVNNFTGRGVVKSFYVPYFCPECDEEKVLLVESSSMGTAPFEPPTCRCDECDLVMDFDDMPDSYFAFLAAHKGAKSGAGVGVEAVIAEFAGQDKEIKVRSRASGSVSMSSSMIGASGSSVPSLPSIASTTPIGSNVEALPETSLSSPSLPPVPIVEPKMGVAVYVLVGVLIAAIAVLGILLVAT